MAALVVLGLLARVSTTTDVDIDKYMSEVCDSKCLQSQQDYPHEDQHQFSYKNYPIFRLPIIDLSQFTNPSTPKQKQTIIESFDHYLSTFGTVSITNHGIPLSLMDEVFKIGQEFFDKSPEYKLQFRNAGLGTSGYDIWKSYAGASAYGIEDQPPDLTEDFAMYNHDGDVMWSDYGPSKDKCPRQLYNISRGYIPSYLLYIVWKQPDIYMIVCCLCFLYALRIWYKTEVRQVLATVHEIAALALGLESDYFERYYQQTPGHHLRWFNYPPLNLSRLLPQQMRVSQHKDFLGFTLQTSVGRGGQMRIGGIWIDVETKTKYDFVLNTGEVYELYTNGHWKPNWHRVIPLRNPRMTVSYLSGPDQDAILKPIEECVVCNKEPQKLVTRTAAPLGKMRYGGADICGDQCPEGQKFFND